MKKVLTIVLLTILCTAFAFANGFMENPITKSPAALTEKMVGVSKERVDEITLAGRSCFMYVPESNRVGRFLALTPMIMVFGDEKFDANSVLSAAETYGCKEIAQRDGVCVLFVNPTTTWEEETQANELFASFFDIYSSKPSVKFTDGVGSITNAETQVSRVVYPGSLHGVQLFGFGSGADFIAENYLKPMTCNTSYAETDYAGVVAPPSGVALFYPTKLSVNTEDGSIIPMAIVDGPENSSEVAASYQRNIGISRVVNNAALDKELVIKLYDEIVSKYYYSQGQLRVSPKYTVNGIVEINDTKTVSSGKSVELYEYIPQDIDISAESSVPVLLWFHGFGGEGEAMLSWSDWPLIAKENGFMVISVDQHVSITAEEVMEAFEQVLNEYPFIDQSRMYISGFSMGSAKTWDIGLKNYKRFAAIVPCALGVFGENEEIANKVKDGGILPVFYLAGGNSPFERGSSAYTQIALKYAFALNEIGDYSYDETKGEWGVTPDSTTYIAYNDDADLVLDPAAQKQALIIDEFKSKNGNAYTWFALNLYKPHTLTNNDAHIVWNYISKFSRAQDGTLIVSE